jgi:hypothetical protein
MPADIVQKERVPQEHTSEYLARLDKQISKLKEYVFKHDTLMQGPSGPQQQRQVTEYVWVKQPMIQPSLAPKYVGPFKVIENRYPNLLIEKSGTNVLINVDRCRDAYGYQPPQNRTDTVVTVDETEDQLTYHSQNDPPETPGLMTTRYGRTVRPVERFGF